MTTTPEVSKSFSLGKVRLTAMPNARKGQGGGTAYYAVHTDVYPTSSMEHRQLFDSGLGGPEGDTGMLAAALDGAGIPEASVSEAYMSHFREDCFDTFLKGGKEGGEPFLSEAVHFISGGDYMPYELTPELEPRLDALTQKLQSVFSDRVNVFSTLNYRSLLAETAGGYTVGHTVFYLQLGGDVRLAFIGELVREYPAQLEHPETASADAADAGAEVASRKAVLDKIIANGWFVAGPHFPFPGIGKVEAGDGGYVFTPVSEEEINAVVSAASAKAAAAEAAKPVIPVLARAALEIVNHTGSDVFIEGDPNWDDQELKVGGKKIYSRAAVASGRKATASVSWKAPADELMMGLCLSDDSSMKGVYVLTVGYRDGAMDVTEQDVLGSPEPGFDFKVTSRTRDMVRIELSGRDASSGK